MPGEWRKATLDQLGRIVTGKTPLSSGPGYFDGDIPFVTPTDFDGRRVIESTGRYLTEQGAGTVTGSRVPRRAVLVSCIGSDMGKAAIAGRECVTNQQINSLVVESGDDPLFVYYNLSTRKAEIRAAAGGSAQPILNKSAFGRLDIYLPPPDEQSAIAQILGTLDDKIELNRRMNETLEAMARALFKSWFVAFDPVRARAEGRDPGLPKEIADLFPDRFEDSELGEIPAGWKVGTLGDVLRQREERCEASAETASRPYVPIECISSKSLFLSDSRPGEDAQSSLIRFYKGDLLFGAMRPYFHKVCIAPFDGTTRTTAFVLLPRRREDFAFATLRLHHPDSIDYATRHSTGSTIPYAVWSDSLEDMPISVPPPEVRGTFDRIMRPLLERIPVPHFEGKILAALRNTLLPKLIAGELRAPLPFRVDQEIAG
jgi:type I restriction enzyme, S subunit